MLRRLLGAVVLLGSVFTPLVVDAVDDAADAAAPPPSLSCGGHGRIGVKSPDLSATQAATYTAKPPAKTDTPSPDPTGDEDCTGDFAATTGNVKAVTFTLKGSASCASLWGDATHPQPWPQNGTFTLTYTNINPATGLHYNTKAFVRLQPAPGVGNLPDAVHVTGQIKSGIGAGATLSTDMLMQPVPTADLDGNGKIDVPTETSGPTMDSYLTWFTPGNDHPCPTPHGPIPMPYLRFDTDAVLHSGFNINYAGPQPEPPTLPVVDCDANGKLTLTDHPNPTPYVKAAGNTTPRPVPWNCDTADATAGPLTKVAFSMTGDSLGACGSSTETPMHGTVTLTFANINPLTGLKYNAHAYVVAHPAPGPNADPCPDPYEPRPCPMEPVPWPGILDGEATCVSGIVYAAKGLPELLGQDFSMGALVHAVPTQDWDHSGKIDLGTATVPSMDSYLQFVNDQANAGPVPHPQTWSTEGAGYGTLLGDPTAVLDSGVSISPIPFPE